MATNTQNQSSFNIVGRQHGLKRLIYGLNIDSIIGKKSKRKAFIMDRA